MQDYKNGDILAVKTADESFEGVVMPSLDSKVLVLKLKNGYNIGIEKNKIKNIKVISSGGKEKAVSASVKANPKLKTILILHTGGTLASKVSYATGGVVARFKPEDILEMAPELRYIANIEARLVRNMFSEDINFSHYNILAKEIEKEVKAKNANGIIITHGTDTIPYTSSALSFMLQGLPIPVLIVGAQRSSDRGSTDAWLNLVCASHFIVNSGFKGVAICMHSSTDDESCDILPGVNTRKIHSSRRDAFKAVNVEKIASVSRDGRTTGYKHHNYKKEFKVTYLNEKLKIGLLKSHPNMLAEELYAYKNFDGLIMEGYGLAGNFPINEIDEFTKENSKIYKAMCDLAGIMPVVMTSQCIFGIVNMNVYETGRRMVEAGVLGNLSTTTTETTFIKLAWLLSNHPKDIKKLMNENICGELSPRTEFEKEFV